MNNVTELHTPHSLFRHLVSSLDIRESGRGRDSLLYHDLRDRLKMGMCKPAAFFAANPGVRTQDILEAFMQVLEPFVAMVEEIYAVLSDLKQQAQGGKDFTIRYDSGQSSLQFNLEAFRIFRKQLVAAQVNKWRVKYDPDAVPGLRHTTESVVKMQDAVPVAIDSIDRPDSALKNSDDLESPQVQPSEMKELLHDLRALSSAHVATLTSVLAELETTGINISTLLSQHGIGPDDKVRFVSSRTTLEQWKEYAEFAERTIPLIDVEKLFQNVTVADIAAKYQDLRWQLEMLGEKTSSTGYIEAMLEFLQLPYWKKRWQVFEIWIFILCLQAFTRRGGELNVTGRNPLVLKTGETDEPKAYIRIHGSLRLELWTEFPLDGKQRSELRPDIAVVVNENGTRTPAGVIECKQRESEADKVLIKDADKYAARISSDKLNLLVNYDEFTGSQLRHGTRRKGRGAETLFLESVRPKTSRADMVMAYVNDLIPPTHTALTYVVDTTGSMHKRLPGIWNAIDSMCATSSGRGTALFSAVLFGDHGPEEPYVTKVLEYTHNRKEFMSGLKSSDKASGGDKPEALEDAVRAANSLPTREAMHRIVVFFVDAPPHAVKDCPKGIDFEDEVEGLSSRAKLWVINCGDESWTDLGWGKFVSRPNISFETFENISSVTKSLK
jgi:hypothetical protein